MISSAPRLECGRRLHADAAAHRPRHEGFVETARKGDINFFWKVADYRLVGPGDCQQSDVG